MKVRLNKITLENYKCFPSKVINFFKKTEISGKNRQGKSTVMNAYMEVITGKENNGSMPDGVRPHDENGEDIQKVDVIRELSVEIDGKPTVIRKITKQKWRKPRGQAEEIFDGNVTTYEIDGFATKQKVYAEFMEKIAKPDILLMCSNANPFLTTLQKSTADARRILEKLVGFDLDEFIRGMGTGYAEIAQILKGHSTEDTLKKLRKQAADQKKKIEAQNTKIGYERTRGNDTPQIEVADLELAKGEWKEKLVGLDAQEKSLDEAVKAYDDLSTQIRELKISKTTYENKAYVQLETRRKELEEKIRPLQRKSHGLCNGVQDLRLELHNAKNSILRFQDAIKQAQKDYKECLSREFDESKLHEIASEQFDENSLICPTCGQVYPEDKQSEKRSLFETGKQKRIHDEQLRKLRFEEETDVRLTEIIEIGNRANENLKAAQNKEAETKKKIAEIQQEIQTVSEEIERLNAELAKLPQEVDLSGNAEYQSLLNQISEKETALSSLDNGSEKRSIIRQQRNEYLAEISKIDSQIQKQIADAEEKERRITELEAELRNMSQIAADIERQVDMVINFSIQKNEELAKQINKYFRHFQFEFLEYTQEGNPVETCKLMCSGTSYFNGLNGGDKKLCEIDLCRGLQEMNNLVLPIWTDECNTIDPWRIPQDLEQQIILIQRTDGELQVKEIV